MDVCCRAVGRCQQLLRLAGSRLGGSDAARHHASDGALSRNSTSYLLGLSTATASIHVAHSFARPDALVKSLQAEVLHTATLSSDTLSDWSSTSVATARERRLEQRQSAAGSAHRTRRALLSEATAIKPQPSMKGYKYLANGALASGQKLYPVECASGPAQRAFCCRTRSCMRTACCDGDNADASAFAGLPRMRW